MEISGNTGTGTRNRGIMPRAAASDISVEHYLRLIVHRKWLVLITFFVVTIMTAVVAWRLPDIYTSETVILVDPQKVPESYVHPTVTGDIRNRLSTLEQQILSTTRLQKIIEALNLYPQERRILAREDVIGRMRKDITISLVNAFGAYQDLQAFKIGYSGREPRLVAQVANDLASLFIEENLKAREQQATGTTEFLQNQLQETRKNLELQEGKLRDFRMRHVGEMPEQQAADLQILGQIQSQLQLESEALSRAEQQKSMAQSMTAQPAPVVDVDSGGANGPASVPGEAKMPAKAPARMTPKAQLESLLKEKLSRGYTDAHPDVKKLRTQIAQEEAKEAKEAKQLAAVEAKQPEAKEPENKKESAAAVPAVEPADVTRSVVRTNTSNPVLVSQLRALDAEIEKHKQELKRLSKVAASYQAKLEAIPVREQEISDLVRDYEISKAHYGQLLEKQLSAETATQLEIRQKGEKFSVLDPAQPAEKPSKPNRKMINAGGAGGGLALGLLLALITEFLGMSITAPEQLADVAGLPVLEVIPIIHTHRDRSRRRRRLVWAMVYGVLVTVLASCSILFYRYHM